ncbi:hypothetical protein [Streptomyces sioyaensis]|uniref:hypothetical protein n=1 Tax=Streptomyces sioyaensis TaxID=67364 RepID=UPI0036ECC8BB
MDNQKLRITLTLRPRSDDPDPDKLEVAAADLRRSIQRLAADHPGFTVKKVEGPNKRRGASDIVIELLPAIINSLAIVLAAYVARQPSVAVNADAKTANGQSVFQGPADEIPETITTTQHGPRTPAEAEAQPPSNDVEP